MKTHTLRLLLAAAMMLPVSLEARTWKEAGSDRSLEGDFSRVEGDLVIIIRRSGNAVKVPLAKLSPEDQAFVAEASAPKPEAVAPAKFKWETDFEVAKQRAKDEKKAILADFTGSDWCGWCIKLKKEVFDEKEFQEYAKEHLIMLELDFPRQSKLSSKLKKQNEMLAAEFKVSGYPTILLMDSMGKEIGRTGYKEGGPANYVEHLKKLLK